LCTTLKMKTVKSNDKDPLWRIWRYTEIMAQKMFMNMIVMLSTARHWNCVYEIRR